jgi:hypothetical protein
MAMGMAKDGSDLPKVPPAHADGRTMSFGSFVPMGAVEKLK